MDSQLRKRNLSPPPNLGRRMRILGMERLDDRLLLSGTPADVISIGRTPSSWSAEEIGTGTFRIRYAVYNQSDTEVTDVRLTTDLTSAVEFVGADVPTSIEGEFLTWNLGRIAPFGRADVEVTVSLSTPGNLVLDAGAHVSGFVGESAVSDSALPLALRSGAIAPGSLAATVDADSSDPFIQAKAAELDQDPARIFAFLTSGIGFEAYAGSLRGARGTLWSGAGNALDKSSLGVALLRASGVPSVYAQGQLTDALAGDLIVSMFPDPFRVTGFIPNGTPVSDPAHDPALLGETRPHFWVRFDAGAGMTDVDPSFAAASVGQTFAAMTGTFAEVPDSLRHKTTIRLDRELVNTAVSGLFGMDPREVSTVLEATFPSARLVGRPLSLGHFVNSSSSVTPVFVSTFNTYAPYLAEGDLAYPMTSDHVIRGTDFQETLTNFPFGSVILTGLFLEIDLIAPDGSTERLQRTLLDRIGYDIRNNGGSPSLSFPPGTTAVTELDITTIDASTGVQPVAAAFGLNAQIQAIQASIEAQRASDGTLPAEASDEMRLFAIGTSRLNVANYLALSGYDRRALGERLLVKPYADKPIVQLSTTRIVADDQGRRFTTGLDLRRTDVRAVAYPGQSFAALPVFQMMRGFRENGFETEVIAAQLRSEAAQSLISTARVFEVAAQAGIDFLFLEAANASQLETLDFAPEAKARIAAALSAGLAVVVPSRSVVIDDQPTVAWYEVDPDSGRTIGVTADGGHQAISEFVNSLLLTILTDIAIGAVVTAWDVIFNPDWHDPEKMKQAANNVTNPISIATAAHDGLKASMAARLALGIVSGLIGVIVSNLLQSLVVGALLNKMDPEAPEYLVSLDPLPELSDLPPTASEIGVGVAKDPLLVLPASGALLPTVFRVGIRNFGSSETTFRLEDLVAPAGFELVASVPNVTIPAGETAEIGLALRPIGPIPPAGSDASFSFRVVDELDPGRRVDFLQPFVVPSFAGLVATVEFDTPGTLPGESVSGTLVLQAVGNMAVNVAMTVTSPDGLTVEGLTDVVLAAGETRRIPVVLTPSADTPLNSTLTAFVRADFGGEEPARAAFPVRVVAPGADAIVAAAQAARDLGNPALSERLDDLSVALTNLATNGSDPVAGSQAIAAIDSIVSLLAIDPVLSAFVPDLVASQDRLESASDPDAVRAAIVSVGDALDTFGAGVVALKRGDFRAWLSPNSREARPLQPETFEIVVQNVGTETTTYRILLPNLPDGVAASLDRSTISLAPGETANVFLTITQTLTTESLAFGFEVPIVLDESPTIGRSVAGSFTARREFVSIVEVKASPTFAASGTPVALSTRLLNAVNRQRDVLVSYVVRDSGGTVVRTGGPVAATLSVQTTLQTIALGALLTDGLADAQYVVEVSVTELDGAPIPGGSGSGSLLIGSPVKASLVTDRDVVAPGTQVVTNTLRIDALQGFVGPLGLVSQTDLPGAGGVIRHGNYLYASGSGGIRVLDISDPAAPQLIRTFGTSADVFEIRGDKLYAIRRGGTFVLSIYSLADPSSPVSLGATPEIPYQNAWHMAVTDTHVFVSIWSLSYFLVSNDIKFQTGDVLSFDVTNPAAPFLDDVLLNTYGTNNDGIGMLSNADNTGGDGNLWALRLVAPDTLLAVGSTASGDNTQIGSGVVHVIDISDPAQMTILRSLTIPGTVSAIGLSIEGDRALVTGSTGGFADGSPNLEMQGDTVIATLDISDPRSPVLIHSETIDRPSSGPFLQYTTALGGGLYAFSSYGGIGGQPSLYVVDINHPNQPVAASTLIPSEASALFGVGSFLYATSASGLSIYRIDAPEAVTATASIAVPRDGTAAIPGSFSTSPSRTIESADVVTYEWDLVFTADTTSRTITWQTVATGLQPGNVRTIAGPGAVTFVSQGTGGRVDLPALKIAVEQIVSMNPAERTIKPGSETDFSVTVSNPSDSAIEYELSVLGIPNDWATLTNRVSVPAGGRVVVPLVLNPGAFVPQAGYDFVVEARAGTTRGSVGGRLVIQGDAELPIASPEAFGVVIQSLTQGAAVGQGMPGLFTARVTNTGSAADTFKLAVEGLPSGFSVEFLADLITLAPGASQFRDVPFRIIAPLDTPAGDYDFVVRATSQGRDDVVSQASFRLSVVAQGVAAVLTPSAGPVGSAFAVFVTNTGSVADTFDLSLGGPAGAFADLMAGAVSLAPGETRRVDITLDAIEHALPGGSTLAVFAQSRSEPNVRGGDSAQVLIASSRDVSIAFDRTSETLPQPGSTTFRMHVTNSGNVETVYRVLIESVDGPANARFIGFDGRLVSELASLRLPAKADTWITLAIDLTQFGQASATVRIVAVEDESIAATASVQVMAQAPVTSTATMLILPEQGLHASDPIILHAAVRGTDGKIPTGFVRFVIDGVARAPVPLVARADDATAELTLFLDAGTHQIQAEFVPNSGFAPSASNIQPLVISPDPVQGNGPTAISVLRYGFHAQPTSFVVQFDADLDPTRANDAANYVLVGPGLDGRLGTRDDRTIRVRSVVHDASNRSVTINPFNRLLLRARYRLVLRGGESGISDTQGRVLDGDRDGRPGGDFVRIIDQRALAGPAPNFRKLSARKLR